MNEQQLQQILTIQQAIAAAATAAVINSLLNPQQAAAGNPLNSLQALQAEQHNQSANDFHQQDALANSRLSPSSGSPVQVANQAAASASTAADNNNRLQELLLQLQLASSSPAANSLNLNLNQQQHAALAAAVAANQQLQANQNNSTRSPPLVGGGGGGGSAGGGGSVAGNRQHSGFLNNSNTATSSNSSPHHQHSTGSILNSNSSQQTSSPNKKLKTRHPHHLQQQQQHQQPPAFPHNVRSSEATSKLHHHQHHSMPKSHSATLSSHQTSKNINHNNSSSSTSSSFLTNNVGLPRKLVRGQDVWLGRGAEQTRQILKCIVCGLSFRTLAEMVQHMKDTQHYTNIVSQEQITSWRQPENPPDHFHKASNRSSNNSKTPQAAQVHSLASNDGQDEQLSEKLNDSDRDDSYGNDDDLLTTSHQQNKSSSQRLFSHQSRVHETSDIKSDSVENINLTDPSLEHSRKVNSKNSSHQRHPRPLTRSKRRQHDDTSSSSINKSHDGDETREGSSSPCESSSSSSPPPPLASSQPQVQRQNSNSSINLLLKDLNEKIESDNDVASDKKLTHRKRSESPTGLAPRSDTELTDDETKKQQENEADDDEAEPEPDEEPDEEAQDHQRKHATRKSVEGIQSEEIQSVIGKERLKKLIDDAEADESDYDENQPDANTDDNADEQNSETTNESILAALKGAQQTGGQKTATGDPLSALETMVEKSFDPRMRPGVANGGILQRLGIDEEVCPPWQHINYANWYAAATYGHPMAAALLAAGLNMQTNGIKLSKNISSKKSDD